MAEPLEREERMKVLVAARLGRSSGGLGGSGLGGGRFRGYLGCQKSGSPLIQASSG